jgi:hypothetical protein
MEVLAVLIITEIMYNPASNEQPPAKTEWVEIYNPSDAAVDLSGWYLQDEDGKTGPAPQGTTIGPKQAVVLIPAECGVEAFREAWGDAVVAVPLSEWGGRPGMSGLGNSPSQTNEILSLVRPDESISDTVNYDDEGDWPSDEPDGVSIYLLPGKLDAAANDDGKNWRRSEAGTHGANACKVTEVFNKPDVGSPGTVAAE